MTVAELIELLGSEDPKAEVVLLDDEWGDYYPVVMIDHSPLRWDYRADKAVPQVLIT